MDPIKKNFLVIVLKLIIYACTLALSFLGAASLTSCAVRRGILDVKATQNGLIIINDTIRLSAAPFSAPTINEMEVGVWGRCPQDLSFEGCYYEVR